MPKKWVIDVNVVLQERDLELPVPGSQDVKENDSVFEQSKDDSAPAFESDKIKKEDTANLPAQPLTPLYPPLPGGELKRGDGEQAQIHARQMQDAYIAKINYQFLIYHTKAFYKNARVAAQAFVNTEMNEVKRDDLNGASAVVKMAYNDDGTIKNIEVSSGSDKFAEILKRVNWKAVPRPYSFMLPYKDVNLNIAVKNGMPVVGIEAL